MPKWIKILLMVLLLPLYIVQTVAYLLISPIAHLVNAIRLTRQASQESSLEKKMVANNIQKTPAYFAIKPSKRSFFAYWKEGIKNDYTKIWEDIKLLELNNFGIIFIMPVILLRQFFQKWTTTTDYTLHVGNKKYEVSMQNDGNEYRLYLISDGNSIEIADDTLVSLLRMKSENIDNDYAIIAEVIKDSKTSNDLEENSIFKILEGIYVLTEAEQQDKDQLCQHNTALMQLLDDAIAQLLDEGVSLSDVSNAERHRRR